MATVKKNIPRSLIRLLNKFGEHKKRAIERVEVITYRAIRSSVRRRTYDTGFFYNSIEVRQKEFASFTTSEFYSNCLYAGYLERGTYKMTARRPFALGLLEAKAEINTEFDAEFTLFARGLGR